MAGVVERKIIFGLGTGRCGTMSLASLLNSQKNSRFTHELGGLPWLSWKRDIGRFTQFSTKILDSGERFIGDVSFYSLPYWKDIDSLGYEAKFIILKRDKKETIASYTKKTIGQNPFMKHDGVKWKHYEWDKCYPKMNAKDKEEAISLYYEHYYELCMQIPEDKRFLIKTEELNDEAKSLDMLRWCGFVDPFFVAFKKNRGKDVK